MAMTLFGCFVLNSDVMGWSRGLIDAKKFSLQMLKIVVCL
jgi:hypothetical protein